jgi:hypothetical protein
MKNVEKIQSDLLTTKETSELLRRSEAALSRDRLLKTGLPFVRVGKRSVRYSRQDIDRYVQERRVLVEA